MLKAMTATGVATVFFDGDIVEASGEPYNATFDFATDTFTGTIIEPDGTVNNLSGYHGTGELPPLGTAPSSADVVLSGMLEYPAGFTVPQGEVWEIDPTVDTLIVSGGNIIVNGTLRAHPDASVTHRIRFVGINEASIAGGHAMAPVVSDVGLWVDGGVLDISGVEKVAWNRTGVDPSWLPSDELIVTPVEVGQYRAAPFVAGSVVPSASSATVGGVTHTWSAEVVNLTRNFAIESVGGRAHIMFINCVSSQRLSHASLVNLGPAGKMGRYPLHVHMCGEGVDGSNFRGNVARDCGNHAFVTHMSHGCDHSWSVAYRTIGAAFWWDDNTETDRCRWDNCGAIDTLPTSGGSATGFVFNEGSGNSCTGAFATGTASLTGAYTWPATANKSDRNVWGVFDCVAHNNESSGVYVWQNDSNPHAVIGFVCYRNKLAGFTHGAYRNRYRYFRCVAFGNDVGDFVAHALGDWMVSGCWLEVFKITRHTLDGGVALIQSSLGWPVRSLIVDEAVNGGVVGGRVVFTSSHWRSDLPQSRVTVQSQTSMIEVVNSSEASFVLTP